ncbi:general odorant-binding protein 56d [Drosophila ficusphila]|uniref:general odorant-binding protein 56d n=1 Tax=Drosophila ficusphila TaxID=30025 RepID=UPI0007E5C056|nr:general odorant-binding protein 56d [Drosophila ficusphila]
MKRLLVSVFLVGFLVQATSAAGLIPEAAVYAAQCAKEQRVPLKLAMSVVTGPFLIRKTKEIKCFIKCFAEKANIFEKNRNVLEGQQNKCDFFKNADDCDDAFQKFECILKIVKRIL